MSIYLETPRLSLRTFTADDVDLLVDLDSDPEVMRYINGGIASDPDEIRETVLPRWLAFYDRDDRFGYWAAIEKKTREFIGWFHLRPDESSGDIELGYRIKRSFWGMGYATEGARSIVHKGFRELGVRRIVAHAIAKNIASIRVLEKVGLRFERHYVEERFAGQDKRAARYALDIDEFDVPATDRMEG